LAKAAARGVEDDAQVGRLLLALDTEQHLAEAVDGTGLDPLGRGQRRERVERAEQKVHRVQDVEARLGAHVTAVNLPEILGCAAIRSSCSWTRPGLLRRVPHVFV